AFGSELVGNVFINIFETIDFPLLLIIVGAIFTALLQSSSAATGIVITMVGTQILTLDAALFIILGANIGTCVTALLASIGANSNSKRVAFIHFAFNVIGSVFFAIIIWIFKNPTVDFLTMCFPGEDQTSLQMRVSLFHVIFNVTTTLLLLPFTKQLVKLSQLVIKEKAKDEEGLSLKFIDDRLLTTPVIALTQVSKEVKYMMDLVEENISSSFKSIITLSSKYTERITENEKIINFTNNELTKYLIKLTSVVDAKSEQTIGSYFHVLNDLERIGDHAENFNEICLDLNKDKLSFSDTAKVDIENMQNKILEMLSIVKEIFLTKNKSRLEQLSELEQQVDNMKKDLTEKHFGRLADGKCSIELSPYYNSAITGLERVADHLVNVGFSIVNPVGEEE
ncbi:MAG: Na/Pi cotransporter family protein, partial [Bacilli bacterium]|nr:Na/Pi cotransporter family protein [Bacilli bacterium]